jgi:hypothetical protein
LLLVRAFILKVNHKYKIVENFQEIPEILQKYPGYKLTFLEIPHYSIYKWNKSHKHPDINKCLAEDDTLANHVAEISHYLFGRSVARQSAGTLWKVTPSLN